MTVRLYEGDKTETGGAGIEITENKVVNLILRNLNNLIKINSNNEVYVDLQLDDNLQSSATLPVGITTGRVVQANGRPVTGTLISAKTTSGDVVKILYGDDGEIRVDNGTGTWKNLTTAYFKTQAEYDALPNSKNSDGNLYIIVDTHYNLMPFNELIQLTPEPAAILNELNTHPHEYMEYYNEEGDVTYQAMTGLPAGKYAEQYGFSTVGYEYWGYNTNLTAEEIVDLGGTQEEAELIASGMWISHTLNP